MKYLPATLCDEISPSHRDHPDAWLVRLPSGSIALDDGKDTDEGRNLADLPLLQEGDVVTFDVYEERPPLTIRWVTDGRSFIDIPDGDANWFWIPGDLDSGCDRLDDVIDYATVAGLDSLMVYCCLNLPSQAWHFDGKRFQLVSGGTGTQ